MAGALSYVHVIVRINISRLNQAVHHFCEKVTLLQQGYNGKEKKAISMVKYGSKINTEASIFFEINHLLELMLKDNDNLQGSLDSLQSPHPRVEESSTGPTQTHDLQIKRHPTVLIATTFLSGVLGTLMVWFTHQRLNNLCNQISEVRNQQHWLLQIQQVTLVRLNELETILREVILEMEQSKASWVNYFALDHSHLQLHFHFQKLMHALQAANLLCLSIDLLDSTQPCHIFDAAARKAKSQHYQLMLRHPSDLFQIEMSYFHNG
jgi:hypothetical protein